MQIITTLNVSISFHFIELVKDCEGSEENSKKRPPMSTRMAALLDTLPDSSPELNWRLIYEKVMCMRPKNRATAPDVAEKGELV